jgi:hypothetical protein
MDNFLAIHHHYPLILFSSFLITTVTAPIAQAQSSLLPDTTLGTESSIVTPFSANSVFLLHPDHVSLANNVITLWDKPRIDWITITDPKETLPPGNRLPQRSEGFSTMVPNRPS